MGKQPEPEELLATPVSELDAVDADVEVAVELDLSLCCDAPMPFDDVEATPIVMCQICMDFFGSKEIVRNVCGPQCLAEICSDCLVQHLTASVYSYYPGVLPKMRCPVCLVALNKIQWKPFVVPVPSAAESHQDESEEANDGEDTEAEEPTVEQQQQADQDDSGWAMDHSHVVEKFEVLCRQSCGFQAPCCHNTEYTMLVRVDERRVHKRMSLNLPTSQAAHMPQLGALFNDYCFHRIEGSEIYAFVMDKFGANAPEILEVMLENMVDDERRAHLLLLHLFHHPDTHTTCCNYEVCFKCKAAEHHNGDCGDFQVDENVLDCPGCRVTLVKVDGCDTVTCLCGYTIEWPAEMQKQRLQRKQLAPLDAREYRYWRVWNYALELCLKDIGELEATLRHQRMQRMLQRHRKVLQLLVDRAVRRARLNILIRQHGERLRPLLRAHLERRNAISDHTLSKRSSLCGDGGRLRIAPAA
jgi:hypothetical protein